MDWFRTAPRFAFTIDEGGVHAEGTMLRERVGDEIVELRANGEEWRARATMQGVTWEKREGGKWAAAPSSPAYGPRLYQRITIAFDPQKKEGAPQLVEPNHFRFTNANSGEVHDVWIGDGGRVARIRIGEAMDLKITP